MSGEEFYKLTERRLEKTKYVLIEKGKEYSTDENKLHNFDKAAIKSNQSREKALKGMLLKHEVSIDDIVENIDKGKLPSRELLDEKIGDIINYYILLEACIVERINNRVESVEKI